MIALLSALLLQAAAEPPAVPIAPAAETLRRYPSGARQGVAAGGLVRQRE